MPRSVPEWIGRTADTQPPPRVRARVFERAGGRCWNCNRKIAPGDQWTLEHVKALINGGENRESNLDVTCEWCLPGKNAADVAEKSASYRKRLKHIGGKPPARNPLPGSRASKWKKKLDGTVVPR